MGWTARNNPTAIKKIRKEIPPKVRQIDRVSVPSMRDILFNSHASHIFRRLLPNLK